jgi:hypothetical protein
MLETTTSSTICTFFSGTKANEECEAERLSPGELREPFMSKSVNLDRLECSGVQEVKKLYCSAVVPHFPERTTSVFRVTKLRGPQTIAKAQLPQV